MVRSPSNASLYPHSLTAGARQDSLKFTSQEEEQVAQTNRTNEDPFPLCVRAEVTRMLTAAVDSPGEKERQILVLENFRVITRLSAQGEECSASPFGSCCTAEKHVRIWPQE
jgi:hypothetical protein